MWTGYVKADKNSPDVGLATAIWNEGEETEFVYKKRMKVSQASARTLRDLAIIERDEFLARKNIDANLSNILTTRLNEV